MKKFSRVIILTLLISLFFMVSVKAATIPTLNIPKVNISVDGAKTPTEYVDNIKLLLLLTSLTFIPAIVLTMTSFTRIVVVLGFVRNALSTQQSPPNQVLIGLAIFMTLFIMTPVYNEINKTAIQPYLKQEITQAEALEIGSKPLKNFMLNQTRNKDLSLFFEVSQIEKPEERLKVPFTVLIPAFIISELRSAFQMGFLIFVPFIVIDMVVASILMSMGMFMLPPVTISLPFKLLLFVMADGWNLIVKSLLASFNWGG